jgi:hypothetical protein
LYLLLLHFNNIQVEYTVYIRMAPPTAVELPEHHQPTEAKHSQLGKQAANGDATLKSNLKPSQIRNVTPLKQTGVLDQYESFDVTPVIGREFPKANLVDWLNAENSDALIRDLAITSTFATSHSLPCHGVSVQC